MTSPIVKMQEIWQNRRWRIALSALLLGVFFGTIGRALPLEDIFIAARTKLRYEKADGSIVVIKIDDKTLGEIHDNDVNPGLDARLIENLMKAGAKEVFFDRTYPFSAQTRGSADLSGTLKRYPERVYFGVARKLSSQGGSSLNMIPDRAFLQSSRLVSLAVLAQTLNMAYSFPYSSDSVVGKLPSLAAAMAGLGEIREGFFRPDFAIDHKTIPSISYYDVLEGKFDPRQVAGRKMVVGWTASTTEYKPLPLGGFVPAVYFHVIAAHTLQRGAALPLGWLPAFLVVALLIVTGVGRGRSIAPLRLAGLGIVLLILPVVLDRFGVELEVVPAAIMAIYATWRARTLDKFRDVSETNAASGLPSFQALRGQDGTSSGLLVALKIRNYAGIVRSFEGRIEGDLAGEIQRRIRISEPDVIVYHEGGMFAWLSNLTDIVELFENLEGLHRIVQNGIVIGETEVDVGFNCGVDSNRGNGLGNRLANAIQSAEEAVRSDELVCHHDDAGGEVHWEISLLTSLDRAIDNGEVWVAFQPKLDLATNRIIGAEALARWSHPERGPISPEKFIGIAEEYHRIERITRFVLDKAVRAAATLVRDGHDFSVSVNISAQLLRNPRLPRMIAETLAAHDLPARHLTLEITETDRLDRSAKTLQMMEELVAAGLRLSIDDFGTGNATIDYLRYLPAAEVKIDKVFIRDVDTNTGDHLLVQSIIEMAHSLGREVVAEGVETAVAMAVLKSLQCDQVQGYYVGRPVPFRDFVTQLQDTRTRSSG
ncbi:EAL domain-containing protein [uncultured Novosphingobium sp.]|uniref:EAL domain-containing protein n=1 Tax=uncultured Novosphingobium sp. TaxID=292277 RepID=UPI002585F1F3|nr:EAL domain-containing protein [uncultured Novosphingobium sp.]